MAEAALVRDKFDELENFARLLEDSEPRPKALVYVSYADTGEEQLLVVPDPVERSQHEFYRRTALLIAKNRVMFPSLDVSDIRIVTESEPYIRGLVPQFHVERHSSIVVRNSVMDGIYIEYAVIFLLALRHREQAA